MGSKGGETYDNRSLESILEFARLLIGKSLAQVSNIPRDELVSKGKGGLGTLVEEAFFDMKSSNKPKPDFGEVSVELKTTPMKWISVDARRKLVAKERLVLSMIDYLQIQHETWETSRLLLKCRLMLILTYLHEQEKDPVDRIFLDRQKLIDLLDDSSVDVRQIKKDWETIREKVRQSRAHELSSADTMYLEAVTKGQGKGKDKLRAQPFSDVPAKPRAFAIKQSYLTSLLSGEDQESVLFSDPNKTLEELTYERFRPYLGKSVEQLSETFEFFGSSKSDKGFHRGLAIRILAKGGSSVPELQKADIELKVVRLKQNGKLREAVSFPNFTYLGIDKEEWEDSSFFARIDRRFLFVVFQETNDGCETLKSVGYWSMPYPDKLEAQRVWEETKSRVQRDIYDFPKSSESSVAHVRPKGRNSRDTFPTLFGGQEKKYCFWLNKDYVQQVVDSL